MPSDRGNRWIAFVLVLSSPFGGCAPPRSVESPPRANAPVAVRTVAVTETELERTTVQPATVHAYFRSQVQPKVAGYVAEIRADIGDVVQAGDSLVVIDIPEMVKQRRVVEARIDRLHAEETRAGAGVELAEARVRSARAGLNEAKSERSRVEASLAAAESEFARTQDLVKRGSLQDRMLDEALKKRDSERAARDAVDSIIESAQAEVGVAEAQRAAAEANREAAKAETAIAQRELEQLDVMIDYTNIGAPIPGIVTERNVEPGDLVGNASQHPGSKPLFVVSRTDRVRVRIPVPESDAAYVNPGDKVTLSFPFFAGEPPIEAAITRTSGSLDASTRTMIVEVELDNPQGKLIPGMFGQAAIELSSKVATNMLPARAIRFSEQGDAYVYVVGPDETVSVTSIETGIDDGTSIEVVSGLQPGQAVIDAHLKRFTDGQKVTVLSGGS